VVEVASESRNNIIASSKLKVFNLILVIVSALLRLTSRGINFLRREFEHVREAAGGGWDTAVTATWLDDGIAPNGEQGRAFGERGVHGFDLTFCAPQERLTGAGAAH